MFRYFNIRMYVYRNQYPRYRILARFQMSCQSEKVAASCSSEEDAFTVEDLVREADLLSRSTPATVLVSARRLTSWATSRSATLQPTIMMRSAGSARAAPQSPLRPALQSTGRPAAAVRATQLGPRPLRLLSSPSRRPRAAPRARPPRARRTMTRLPRAVAASEPAAVQRMSLRSSRQGS
jgi:hypothetical protein